MALPTRKPLLNKELYLHKLHSGTENYKKVRDQVEDVFNKSEGLPDVAHTPLTLRLNRNSMSDEENINKKRELYQWDCEGGYPPHIKIVPYDDQVNLLRIFSTLRLLQFADIEGDIKEFFGSSDEPKVTMESIDKRYKELAEECRIFPDMYTAPNIGVRPNRTGTPTLFLLNNRSLASTPSAYDKSQQSKTHDWLAEFLQAAEDQKNDAFQTLVSLCPPENFYVVDNSDYRKLIGLDSDAILSSTNDGKDPSTGKPIETDSGAPPAYGAASVTLYTLDDTGILHPVAICLDYRGPLGASGNVHSKSVTIFNRRTVHTITDVDERTEWDWRFAKMTASMSDWLRHELTSHLTETHLVEEAIIIAAQRNLPDGHIIYDLLHPHWYKTLSLNVLARSALVPIFIKSIAPIPLEKLVELIKQTYLDFDFVGRYVPNDLASRGFPIEALKLDADKASDGKFHNYLYARGVATTWDVIRKFVSKVLKSAYPNGDSDVKADSHIADFCAEMRKGTEAYSAVAVPPPATPPKKEGWWDTIKKDAGAVVHAVEDGIDGIVHSLEGTSHHESHRNFGPGPSKIELGGAMRTFPSPQTLDELIDMVTISNLSFIPNRPASFTAEIPSTIHQLKGYTEEDIVKALPINTDADRRQWMDMAQLPYLLSAEVDPENNMIQYARDVGKSPNKHIRAAAANFEKAVGDLDAKLVTFNNQMDDQTNAVRCLEPQVVGAVDTDLAECYAKLSIPTFPLPKDSMYM